MNKQKKIMILGASILQLPAIIKAKEMGLEVIVVDMDKDAVGFKHADIRLVISTIDIEKVVEAAKKYQIDGIMTLASDMPMRTVAAVAKELRIVGISEDTALKATDKALMRSCLRDHQVPIPEFYIVSTYDEYIAAVARFSDRFIVKPIDNSGSRGVFLVNDKLNVETVEYAYEYSKKFSRCETIIIEDYMAGEEVSVETISLNGEVNVIQITDKLTTGSPRFVEMGHSQPTCHNGNTVAEIQQIVCAAVKALNITNGPSHTEIKLTKDGPKVVEVGARLGGDCITSHLVTLSTGVDMVECSIKVALGQYPDINRKITKGSAIRYFNSCEGVLKDIRGDDDARKLEGIRQVSFVKKINDKISGIYSSSDRIGFVVSQADDAKSAIEVCEMALRKIEIVIS